jgi:hypothetical protein
MKSLKYILRSIWHFLVHCDCCQVQPKQTERRTRPWHPMTELPTKEKNYLLRMSWPGTTFGGHKFKGGIYHDIRAYTKNEGFRVGDHEFIHEWMEIPE